MRLERITVVTSPPTARSAPLARVPREIWRVASVVTIGSFMSTLSSSLVNVGLKTIGQALDSPLAQVQWVASGYLTAFAAFLPFTAWMSRRLGPGRLWLFALTGFTVTSALCALAPNLWLLVCMRVLQGMSGAMLVPTGQTVVGQLAGPQRMGRVLNSMKIVSVLGPVLGPTIGGLLISGMSWRWLFMVNVPVGILALLAGLRIVPRGEPITGRHFDAPGFALVAVGLPLTMYGVTEISQAHGTAGPAVLGTLVPGIVLLALFVRHSLTTAAPLLDLRLFTNRVYTAAVTSVFFTGAALLGTMVLFPLYFQLLRHESVIHTGLLMLAVGGGTALSMPFGGVLTDKIGGGVITVVGLLGSVASILPLIFLGQHVNLAVVEALQVVTGFGLGIAAMPALSVAYATVPRDRLPDATSEATIIQRIGGSIGTTTLVVVLESSTTNPSIESFRSACTWLAGSTVVALGLAIWLAAEERRR
ncbi:DHA2 family efflux MFS transporter permease subunit [Kitasatospora sp. NPDC094011]|uniref:DHA2 family efflux MFS transporter permease subunit n=1 Tax=Kitasatospora sp. NPDC094011 TaxID=3364090 RepID=UPI0037FDB041